MGNGYNHSSGVFTSPKEGTFVFYVSAVGYSSQLIEMDIVLNSVSQVKLHCHSSSSYQTGTNMVVLNLQKGDSVWVKYGAGKGYFSFYVPMTTFSGFLVS